MKHSHPVEDMLFMPSGSLLLTAGGNKITVWDISRGQEVQTFSNHQKTITCLAMDGTRTRLLSGGLDGHVKVYSMSTYAVTHGFKYDAPVISLGVSPDSNVLMVGTSDGGLVVRRRDTQTKVPKSSSIPPERIHGGTAKYFERGKNVPNTEVMAEDLQAILLRKQRLRPYDLALRRFRYHDALDAALVSRSPTVVVTILEELIYRQGLHKALSGRDECTLEPLLSFLARYTTNPRYSSLLIDVCAVVFEIYKNVLGQSEAIDELFTRLGRQVKSELSFQKNLLGLMGSIDTVMSRASHDDSASVASAIP
jgi:U3 small nucleolar RNA-associated protein 15